jgi:protein TonB
MKSFFHQSAPVLLAFLLAAALLPAHAAPPKPHPAPSAEQTALDEEAKARALEAEIQRRRQEYTQRLRRTQIGGSVTDKRFEQYLAAFRRKIACSSLKHYPEAARDKTYGDLIITVSVLADGSFEKARIDRSSGLKVLDDGALDIARQAAPFAPFPPEIRRDFDALDITRTWTFTFTEGEATAADDPCA